MKKHIFTDLSKEDLHDAGTYFPRLIEDRDVGNYLDQQDLDLIDTNSKYFNSLDDRTRILKVIETYFDLDKYGDLSQLSDFEWVAQLTVRKKILNCLYQNNGSNHEKGLQSAIFALVQIPVVDSSKFGPRISTNHIADLTVLELHSISKTYLNNGCFDFIDHDLDLIGPDIDGNIPDEKYSLINLNSPIEYHEICDNKFKVVATVDLSISDAQLKSELADFIERKRRQLDLKPIVAEFKNKDKVALIKHSVLQYLDLLVLTRYVGPAAKLTSSTYATLLFPETHSDYDKAYGKFNDSTLHYADKVLNGDTIPKLLSSLKKQQSPSFVRI